VTRHRKIGTAPELRRREAAARRVQDAAGPASEIARLQAHVVELLATVRRLELANAGLRRRLDDVECEDGE
jgi:regulator of replication initiation timing